MTEYEQLRESMQHYENEHYNNLRKHGELLKKIKGNIENHADRKQYGYLLGRDVIEHLATDIIEDLQIDKLTARLEKAESENKQLREEMDIIVAANIELHSALEQAELKLNNAIRDVENLGSCRGCLYFYSQGIPSGQNCRNGDCSHRDYGMAGTNMWKWRGMEEEQK